MCVFQLSRGFLWVFPISISPRPSNAKRTNFARVCKAKKKIDRADLLATTHREINSFFVERKYKTYPAISRLLPMRMQRNSSSFGRRDDETEDRKEIYLSILFFFELFSVGARKIIHKTPPRLTLATREGERVRVVLDLSAEGVSLLAASFFLTRSSSSFVVKSYEKFFFLFEA